MTATILDIPALGPADVSTALQHSDQCAHCERVAAAFAALQRRAIAWLTNRCPPAAMLVQSGIPGLGPDMPPASALDVCFRMLREDGASARPTAVDATVGYRLHCPTCLGALNCTACKAVSVAVSVDVAIVSQCMCELSAGVYGGRLLEAEHRRVTGGHLGPLTAAANRPPPHETMLACYRACAAIVT